MLFVNIPRRIIKWHMRENGPDESSENWLRAVIEVYKNDLDRTMLRENLRLTSQQRLENLMALQKFAEELRRAGKELRR